MRILHLPYNIASQISVTVRALRAVGADARGLAESGVVTANDSYEPLPAAVGPRARRLAQKLRGMLVVARAISWADVVHWHYDAYAARSAADLRLARRLGKRRIVEFWGSDIRIPAIEARDNPYYARVFAASEYHGVESYTNSRRRQERFARQGVAALAPCPSMVPHVITDLFPYLYRTRQRIALADYAPAYPDAAATRPLVIHSPTAPIAKGTYAVEAAVEQLGRTHALEYRRVQGVPYAQARMLMQGCDIFVDQLICGSHGLAALEAMAFGKPVICYIKPSMAAQYPPELPIVSATVDDLPEVLARLLEDGALRRELGRRGRAYVEKYHDSHMLARQLIAIYQGLQP